MDLLNVIRKGTYLVDKLGKSIHKNDIDCGAMIDQEVIT